jgi:hypothetical protein
MNNGQGSVTIGRRDTNVVVFNNDIQVGTALTWEFAIALSLGMRRKAKPSKWGRESERIDAHLTVRRSDDDSQVLVEYMGRPLVVAPLEAAIQLGVALTAKAREVEAELKAEETAKDEAIVFRSQLLPFLSLTDNPAIRKMAEVEAAWGDTRRYFPMIKTQEHVWPPSIKVAPPKAT